MGDQTGMNGAEPQANSPPDSTTGRILAATCKVYAEAGFRGTTTRRVAQEAGVNEITLFRHFGTKEALVMAALSRTYQEACPANLVDPVDPAAELYDWAISTYRHWYAARHLISKVLSDLVERPELAPGICQEPSCKHVMLSGYLDRLRQRGLATGDFSPGAAAGMLIGAVFSHAIWRDHFANPDLPPPEEVVRHYVQLLLASLGYRQAPTKGREMA